MVKLIRPDMRLAELNRLVKEHNEMAEDFLRCLVLLTRQLAVRRTEIEQFDQLLADYNELLSRTQRIRQLEEENHHLWAVIAELNEELKMFENNQDVLTLRLDADPAARRAALYYAYCIFEESPDQARALAERVGQLEPELFLKDLPIRSVWAELEKMYKQIRVMGSEIEALKREREQLLHRIEELEKEELVLEERR